MGKFNNISDFQSDDQAELDGVDLSFGGGRFITVRRAASSNREYKSALANMFKPHMLSSGGIAMDDEEAVGLLMRVYAKAVVVGWRGFKDEDGKEIPFNQTNCVELFTDAPEIFQVVQDQSAKFSNFAKKEVESSAKKSQTT